MIVHFAVTARKHAKKTAPVTESDYERLLAHLGTLLQHHTFENDKNKPHVHMHGILGLPKGYLRKKLTLEGYNLKIEPIYDFQGWEKYIHKDQSLQERVSMCLFAAQSDARVNSPSP